MKLYFIRPMPARDPSDTHRAATPLELFFDLVSVIAIAAAAAGLHHAIAENHAVDGIISYTISFWAIWWAWMNFTWFASAYDNDDVLYRLLVMVMMTGALIMAAGIPYLFKTLASGMIIVGFVVMRLAMCALWLRAARHDPERAATALKYAKGIAIVQTIWVVGYFLVPEQLFLAFIALGFVSELMVPIVAEQSGNTTWHRHHIIERYGLLTIIVLGESLLALATAISSTTDIEFRDHNLLLLITGGLLIVYTMWWLYFSETEHAALDGSMFTGFLWGYGHLIIFGTIAAVGAGLAVGIDFVTHHAEISQVAANASVSIPAAIFMIALYIIHEKFHTRGERAQFLYPLTAVLILIATYSPYAPLVIGLIMAACLTLKLRYHAWKGMAG